MTNIQRCTAALICLCLILSFSFLSQWIYSNQIANAENQIDRYWSALTGDQQSPPVNTTARGYVGLKFQDDLAKLVYIINAENIGKVTGVYLYRLYKDGDTSVILDLLHPPKEQKKDVGKVVDKTAEGKTNGTITLGGITDSDLRGPLHGKTLSDLYKLMVNGSLFVSVYTKDYPNGEIRGNSFVPMDDLFPDLSKIRWHKPMTENDKNKPELIVLPVCGMQCNVKVTQSLDHVRDEINNGNITGALLELHAAQTALNRSKD